MSNVSSERLKARYAAERRFRALGLVAVVFSALVLAFLLFTMTANAIGGFKRAELRFTVETNDRWTTRWLDWAHAQHIDRGWRDTLVRIGGGPDAAAHWFISFAKVPRADWLEVRNMHTQEVIDVDRV